MTQISAVLTADRSSQTHQFDKPFKSTHEQVKIASPGDLISVLDNSDRTEYLFIALNDQKIVLPLSDIATRTKILLRRGEMQIKNYRVFDERIMIVECTDDA